MKKAFIVSDVLLDVLANQKSFVQYSSLILELGLKKKLDLYTSAICFANIYYVLVKQLGKTSAKQKMAKLKTFISISPTTDQAITQALASSFPDLEDGIQHYTAADNNLDFIITRNIKDFKSAIIPVFTPEEYLASLN